MSHSTLSIYGQLPQHMSLGIAQIFGLLASLEFAYFIAPRSAQSLFMSFHSISRILADYIVEGYMANFKLDFSVCMKIKSYLYVVSYILRILTVYKQRTMDNICLFLHFCQYSDNIHYYLYSMSKILSDDQDKTTTNGKKPLESSTNSVH